MVRSGDGQDETGLESSLQPPHQGVRASRRVEQSHGSCEANAAPWGRGQGHSFRLQHVQCRICGEFSYFTIFSHITTNTVTFMIILVITIVRIVTVHIIFKRTIILIIRYLKLVPHVLVILLFYFDLFAYIYAGSKNKRTRSRVDKFKRRIRFEQQWCGLPSHAHDIMDSSSKASLLNVHVVDLALMNVSPDKWSLCFEYDPLLQIPRGYDGTEVASRPRLRCVLRVWLSTIMW